MPVVLVGARHVLIEYGFSDRHQTWVRDPRPVASVVHFAELVLANFRKRNFVGRGVILDRDLRRHSAHGRGTAAMAGFHQEQRVGPHERRGHRHLRAVSEAKTTARAELLYAGKDVIPSTDVETGGVLAQLPKDFVHFERGNYRLDQRSGLDRSLRHARFLLGELENIVPKPRLEMGLHLRQVEIRPGVACKQLFGVVKEIQRKVEYRSRNGLPVHKQMLFIQMPASRARNQNRHLAFQPICLSLLFEIDVPAYGIVQVDLTFDHVGPSRAVGVLEVRHERRSARIERVYHHFSIGRPSDLHAAVQQIFRLSCDRPVLGAKRCGFRNEIGEFAGVKFSLARSAKREQILTAGFEGAVQLGDEAQGFGCQNPCRFGQGGSADINPCRKSRR